MVVSNSSVPDFPAIMLGLENPTGVKLNSHKHKLKHRFEIVRKLGQGTYGKVQLAVNRETGQEVAIKTIKKAKIETEQDLVRIRREIQIMSSVQHPSIIHIYEVFENREKMILVMEYAAGGELYDYLSDRKVLAEEEARRIFRQISAAVYYCHKHKICHRDLKLENILLDDKGNAKIADFGLSNVFDGKNCLNTFCGSPLYASPEIVKGIPYYGPEVDCWSLGVLLYTLVYGAMPFDGSNFKRLVKQITGGDYFEPNKKSEASELIRCILTVSPKRRADIEDICSHWWVNEGYSISCLEVADELACQTPVRLDLLLSLAPAPKSAEKLVIDKPAGEAGGKEEEKVEGATAAAAGIEMELEGAVGGPIEVVKNQKPAKNGKPPSSPEASKAVENFAKDLSTGSLKGAEPSMASTVRGAEAAPPAKKPMTRHLSLTSKHAKEKMARLEESDPSLPLPTPPPTPPAASVGGTVPEVQQPSLPPEKTSAKLETDVPEVQPKEKKVKKVKKVETEAQSELSVPAVAAESRKKDEEVAVATPQPSEPIVEPEKPPIEKVSTKEEQPTPFEQPEAAKPTTIDGSDTSSVASSTATATPKKKVVKKVIKSKVPKAATKEVEKPESEVERKASSPEKRTSPPSPAVKKSATAKAGTTTTTTMEEKPSATIVRRSSKNISETAKAFDVANGSTAVPSKIPSSVGSGSKTLERPKKLVLPGLSNIRDAKKAFEVKESAVDKPKPLVLPSRTVSDAKRRFEVPGGGTAGAVAAVGKPPVAPTSGGATKSKTEGRISSVPFAEKIAKIVAKTKEKTPPKIEKKEPKVKQKSPPLAKNKGKVKEEEKEKAEVEKVTEEKTDVEKSQPVPALVLAEEKPSSSTSNGEHGKVVREQKKASLKGTLKAAATAKTTKSPAVDTSKPPEGCKTVMMEVSPNVTIEATMRIDSGEPAPAMIAKPAPAAKGLPTTASSGAHGLHRPPPLPPPSSSTMSAGASNAKSAEIPGSETSFLRKATTPGPAEPATVTSPQRRSFVATVSTSSTSSMPTVLIPFTSTSALTPPTPTREDSVTPTPSELPRAPSPILAVSASARVTSPTATPTAEVAPAPIHVRSISAPVRHMFSPPPPAVLPPRAPSVGKERLVPIFLADSDVPVSSYQQQQQQQQKPMQQQREGSIGRSFFTSPLERRDSSRSERDWSEASSVSGRQTPAPAPAPARAGAAAGTTAAGGLKHSRREYIIPIALEDGGFASAPSTASATPTPSTASTMSSPFFHERSATPAVGTTSGEGAVGGSSDMFGTFGRGAMGSSRTSSGRRMWSLFNEEETPSLGNMRLQRLSSFGKSMPTSNAAYKSATKSAGSSSHPKSRFKSTIDRSDSFSSAGEEDDDEEGFEILTAESLFSTLLERVRNLSRRMNKDDSLFSRINSPLVSGPSETPASSTASRQESPSPWSTDSNWPLHTRYGSSSAGQQRAPKTPVRTNSLKSTYATSGVALATGGAGSSSGRTTPTGSMMASATLPRSGWASPAAYFRSSLKNYDDPHSSEGYDPARRKESDTQSCYSDSAALPTSSYQGRNNPPRQSESPPPSASSVGPELTASLARRVANYFSRAPSYELHSIKENESGGLRSRHLGAGDSAAAMARRAQQAYTAAGEGGTGNNVDHPGSTSGLKYGRTGRAKTAGSLLPSASSSGEEEGAAAGGARQPQKQRTTSSSFRPESRYSMYLSGTADDSAASSAGMSASSSINKAMSKSTYGGDFGLGSSSRPDSALGDFSSSSIGASGYQTLPRSGFQRPVSMIDPQPIAGSRDFSKSQYLTPSSEDSSMPSRRDAKRYTGNLSDSWQSTADLMSSSASGGLPPGVSNNSANNRDAARRISSYLNDALRRHGAGYTSTINLSAPPSVIASGTQSVVSDGPPSTSAGNSSSNKMSTYNPDLSSDFNSSNNFSSATLGRPSRRITVTGAPPPVAASKRWSTMMNYGAGGFNPQEPFVGSILPKLEESLMMNSMPSSGNKVNGSSGSRSAQLLMPAAEAGIATAELAGPMLRDPPAADSWSANHLPSVVGSNGNQDQTDTCSVSASSDVSDLDTSISSCIDGESVSERILRKSYYSRFNDSLSRRRSASTHPKISSSSLSAASSISKLMGSSFENLAASSSAGGIPAGKKKAKSRTETSVDKVGEATGLPKSGGEKARIRHASRDRAAGGPSAGKSGSSSGTKKKTNCAAGSGELPTISHKGGDSSSRTEVHGSVTRV